VGGALAMTLGNRYWNSRIASIRIPGNARIFFVGVQLSSKRISDIYIITTASFHPH
jgi:hypothetical protein